MIWLSSIPKYAKAFTASNYYEIRVSAFLGSEIFERYFKILKSLSPHIKDCRLLDRHKV